MKLLTRINWNWYTAQGTSQRLWPGGKGAFHKIRLSKNLGFSPFLILESCCQFHKSSRSEAIRLKLTYGTVWFSSSSAGSRSKVLSTMCRDWKSRRNTLHRLLPAGEVCILILWFNDWDSFCHRKTAIRGEAASYKHVLLLNLLRIYRRFFILALRNGLIAINLHILKSSVGIIGYYNRNILKIVSNFPSIICHLIFMSLVVAEVKAAIMIFITNF